MWNRLFASLVLLCLLGACNALASPSPTPSPSPTASLTATAALSATPTATASHTPTSTATPTASHTPTVTYTPSVTPTASITPAAVPNFRSDLLTLLLDIPNTIINGVDEPLIVFTNSNNQVTISNIATAQPENTTQTLYFVRPNGTNRVPILNFNSSVDEQIFLAPNAAALAYFLPRGEQAGLHILNIRTSSPFSTRVWQTNSLTQKGIYSRPVWTADGEFLAVTLQTEYDLDIFLYSRDGSRRDNLTNAGSYEMFPSFSPDGRYMAFVSDRADCPSWIPSPDAPFCDALTREAPYGGQVYLLDMQTRSVQQLSDVFVTEAPRWINARLLTFAGGDQTDLLNPQRTIWLASVNSASARQVLLQGDDDSVLYLSDAWSADGLYVVLQRATVSDTEIVLMKNDGTVVRRRPDLSFPRFGMQASWSLLGERFAIGGVDGSCPLGVRVADQTFDWVATGNPPPSMCDVAFSPDGQSLAFTGVNPRVDGRLDIYSANANGFGAQNLTVDLTGTMNLVGWIGQP